MARPTLFTHPKFRRLVHLLKAPVPHVVGYLECLWSVAYECGEPVIGDEIDVEIAAQWPGDCGALCRALVQVGLIDPVGDSGRYAIHDFWDHAPDYVKKRRERELERKNRSVKLNGVSAERQPLSAERRTLSAEKSKTAPRGLTPTPAPTPAPTPTPEEDPPKPPVPGGVSETDVDPADWPPGPPAPQPPEGPPRPADPPPEPDDGPRPGQPWQAFLATEWAFHFAGTQRSERDLIRLGKFFGDLIATGHDPPKILRHIRDPSRSKRQATWDFERQFFTRKDGPNANGNGRPTRRSYRFREGDSHAGA